MKRLLVALVLIALPITAAAGGSSDNILLSSTGSVYTVASEIPTEDSDSQANYHLVMTERHGDQTLREVIPATKVRGSHSNALLGYDRQSGTIFVFWIQHFGFMYNQLLFCSRDRAGSWSEATPLGSPYHYRENLRMAITRRVEDETGGASTSGLTIHVTWWEFDSQTGLETAQYWMLPIENGRVFDPTEVDLQSFVDVEAASVLEDLQSPVLRQPQIVSSPQKDSVLLVFGDVATKNITRVRFTPRKIISNGRVWIPVGKREGTVPAPRMNITSGSRIEGVFGAPDQSSFYTLENGYLRYVILLAGQWSEQRAISLDQQVSPDAAAAALHALVTEH